MTIRRGLLSSGCGLVLLLTPGPAATAGDGIPDPFFLIERNIVMSEVSQELPVPDYELVDINGTFKNAPDSIACGGTVSEGAAEDADSCLLLPQLQFVNGYLKAAGTVVTPNATAYNGNPGNYEIIGHVGDVVQFTVKNQLPEAVNQEAIATGWFAPADNRQIIHWHGMELDNESDGTPVTEFGIPTGKQRLYQYRLYRPGNYWFHPHVAPLSTESRGIVGRLQVRSYEEDLLTLLGVLPLQKLYVQLTDGTVANQVNRFVHRGGIIFNIFSDEEVDNHLMPDLAPDLNGDGKCDRGIQAGDCIVREGELVFVNGVVPTSDDNIPTVYVPEGRGARIAFVDSSVERFYRLRLLLEGEEPPFGPALQANAAGGGECYAAGSNVKFSGRDPLSCDQGLVMYRIGGQNGLLDHVRVEGQPERAPGEPVRPYDTIIRRGEDFLGVSERTEFVIVTKDRTGNYLQPGQSMYIWTIDYPHGAFGAKFNQLIGNGASNNRDIAARKLVRIKIVPDVLGLPNYDIAENAPLMAHPLINRPSEDLKGLPTVQLAAVPLGEEPHIPGHSWHGTEDEVIMLTNRTSANLRVPSVNAETAEHEGVTESGHDVHTANTTRYAHLGDVIEFVYANNTGAAHHPLHPHGFSIQPISIHSFTAIDTNDDGVPDSATLIEPPLYTYDYNEFIDVEAMQPNKALKYRMKLTDRYKIPDATDHSYIDLLLKYPYDYQGTFGGAGDLPQLSLLGAEMGGGVGRWMTHCHILHHAGQGMMAELCSAQQGAPDASGCKIDVDPNIYLPIP